MNLEQFDMNTNKFKLLTLLVKNSKFVSAVNIAKELNLSRESIFKHINSLRGEGLRIDSTPDKEYKLHLLSKIDSISPTFIKYLLKDNHLFHTCLTFEKIDSTQTVVKKLALEKALPGIVATAEFQNLGRGRRGRSWANSKGKNLMFSILLTPKLKPENMQLLNLAVAFAVRTVLFTEYNIAADLKWPNDILVKDKKICGILSELVGEPDNNCYVVTGIGLNVNMKKEDFNSEISNIATSILIESGRVISRSYLLVNILNQITTIIKLLDTDEGLRKLLTSYKKTCVTLGKEITVTENNETYTGFAVDITDQGALIVKINGNDIIFFAADIKHLRNKQEVQKP